MDKTKSEFTIKNIFCIIFTLLFIICLFFCISTVKSVKYAESTRNELLVKKESWLNIVEDVLILYFNAQTETTWENARCVDCLTDDCKKQVYKTRFEDFQPCIFDKYVIVNKQYEIKDDISDSFRILVNVIVDIEGRKNSVSFIFEVYNNKINSIDMY